MKGRNAQLLCNRQNPANSGAAEGPIPFPRVTPHAESIFFYVSPKT